MGIIYKLTNTINNKVYIGQTVRTLHQRWRQHIVSAASHKRPTRINNAICKYGSSCFVPEVVIVVPDKELDAAEIKAIAQYQSTDRQKGYNISVGGNHRSASPEARENMRLRMLGNKRALGYKQTPEHIEARASLRRGGSSWAKGKKFSAEHRSKIAEASRKRTLSAEARAKISAANTGLKRTSEVIAAQIARRLGTKRSPETKAKMAESRRRWWLNHPDYVKPKKKILTQENM